MKKNKRVVHLGARVTLQHQAMLKDLQREYGLRDTSATLRACIEAARDQGLAVDRTSEVKDG